MLIERVLVKARQGSNTQLLFKNMSESSKSKKKTIKKIDRGYEKIKQEISSKARKKKAAEERGDQEAPQFEM